MSHALDGALVCYQDIRVTGQFCKALRTDTGILRVNPGKNSNREYAVFWFDGDDKHPGQVDEVNDKLYGPGWRLLVLSLHGEWEPVDPSLAFGGAFDGLQAVT